MSKTHKLPNSARVVLIVDGLQVPTTMRELRRGAMSSCIAQLVVDFEAVRKMKHEAGEPMPIAYVAVYADFYGASRNLQINLDQL